MATAAVEYNPAISAGYGAGSGLVVNSTNLDNQLIVGKAGGQTILFGTATTDGGAISTNSLQNGLVAFGTITAPSRWVDSTAALGTDVWNFNSGKNGGGKRAVAIFQNRGSSLADDVRLGFNPAGGSTYGTAGSTNLNNAIDILLLSGSEYQIALLPGNSSGVPTTTFTASGLNKVCTMAGGFKRPWNAQTATSYTVLLSDYYISSDTTSGNTIITAPSAVTAGAGATFEFKRITAGGNTLTIKATAGTIDGTAAATGILMPTQYQWRRITSDGANWNITGSYL